jgi:hypothetical protein
VRASAPDWADFDRLLTDLPQSLFRQVKLVEYELGLRLSRTGRLQDVRRDPDRLPVLALPGMLLDDFGMQPGPDREATERDLFLAGVLLAVRTHTVEQMVRWPSFADGRQAALVQLCTERVLRTLARVVPPEDPYWERRDAISLDDLDRTLELVGDDGPDPASDPESLLPGRWAAPLKQLGLASAAVSRSENAADDLARLLDDLAAAFQVAADLTSFHRDVLEGRVTHPIAVVAQRAGLALRPWPTPAVLLGALAATGSLATIVGAAEQRLRSAHEVALKLGLAGLDAFTREALTRLSERTGSFEAGWPAPEGSTTAGAPRPLLQLAQPPIENALDMAESFLVAEAPFRESWETHREGMFGSGYVTSRFPSGLILEILVRHGQDMGPAIGELLDATVANGFRYYEHPWSDVDADTVGMFLRLRQCVGPVAAREQALRDVLRCVGATVQELGRVPVWFPRCTRDADRPAVITLGEGCGTVEAHLLLGLLGTEEEELGEVLEVGAAHLFGRIQEIGLGANVNYPPGYALGIFLRLAGSVQRAGMGSAVTTAAGEVFAVLDVALQEAVLVPPRSSQDAALKVIACHEARRGDLVDGRWIVQILKSQRFDGSWRSEPFAAAPNRGQGMTWYSSNQLTSALCYDALARTARGAGPAGGATPARLA